MEERISPSAPANDGGLNRAHLDTSAYLSRALEVPIAQRDAWLELLASSEPDVAADVRRLLAAQTTAGFAHFLNEPMAQAPAPRALTGELIGSFRVLREIGHGGMAVVYLAERADGQYFQQAALKILRLGLTGSQAQLHFAQERQILASLDHQSIARLIDAGVTATGLPYFAMEYVEGVPIDRYCDEQRLDIDARLQLFLKVAEALQYAHRHLIVHRDLKASNILVTHAGDVKLLDFGIAKLLAPTAFEHAAPPTRDGLRLMTPEYASPEQVLGQRITTATDIYQLGLLLYRMLTGREPYAVRGRTPIDAFRVICESEPTAPSSALEHAQADDDTQAITIANISATRATSPARLRRSLRNDLDAILLKALRKEPAQRYASVEWLIDDIQRHRRGLPISAYQGVWLYRAAKFSRRHASVLVVTGVAILTVVFLTAWYTVQLASERNRAQLEAASATQVAEFLASVFRGSSSRVANGGTTARELLDRGAERIETELALQPEIKARLLNVIGDVYIQYDLSDQAQPLLERALEQNTKLFGGTSKEVSDSLAALATLARKRDDLAKARELYEQALHIRERTLGPRHAATAETLSALAATSLRLGDSASALRYSEQSLEIYSTAVGPDDERILSATNVFATAAVDSGDLQRARALFEQLLPRIERSLGAKHRNYAQALGNLSYVQVELGEYQGVEEQLNRSIQITQQLYGPDHGSINNRRVVTGLLFNQTGRLSEAIAAFEHAIDSQRRVTGPGHRLEAHALWGMGSALRSRGDLDQALQRLEAALAIHRRLVGASHDDYAGVLLDYGEILLEMNNLPAAATALNEAGVAFRGSRAPNHYEIAMAQHGNGLLLLRTGDPARAEIEIREALSVYQRTFPRGHRSIASANSALGECLLAEGRTTEAEQLLVSSARQLQGSLHFDRRLALRRLLRLYQHNGNHTSARQTEAELTAFEQQVRSR
jgi:serine/threonine-protein kinase